MQIRGAVTRLCGFTVFLACVCLPGLSSYAGGALHDPARFAWNWRKASELTSKQSISRTRNLANAERDRLISAITSQLRSADSAVRFGSEAELRRLAAETRIKYVDLNGDGRPEVIAQAGGENSDCSPTGNCPLWILSRRGDRYNLLLEAQAQTFTVQPSRSKNFFDIVLTRHASAFESEAVVYKFNGQTFDPRRCYTVEWTKLSKDGEDRLLKEPLFIPCDAQPASVK